MEKSRDFLTGVVFFVLLGTLGFFTIILADVKFGDRPTRTVLFDAIEGLEYGNPVRIDGVRSGRVKDVLRPAGERKIHVVLEFDEEPILFEGATFTIESASMLGGRVMVIENPTGATAPLAADAMPPGRVAGDPLAQAGKLLDDETIDSVKRTLANLEATSQWLKSDGALALAEIRAVIADVRSYTPALATDGTALLADLRSAAADISEFTPALKTEGPALLAEIRSVVADVKAFWREGQTFLTWREDASVKGEWYHVYASDRPITAANLRKAELVAKIPEGSNKFGFFRNVDTSRLLRHKYLS